MVNYFANFLGAKKNLQTSWRPVFGYPLKTAVNFSGDNEINLVGGIPTPLKNDGVRTSWDDEINSQLFLESHNPAMFQTTNQLYYSLDQVCITNNHY